MKKNHLLLYVALALPMLMIFVIFIGMRFFPVELSPQYNFLYATSKSRTYYVCRQQIMAVLFPQKNQTQNFASSYKQPICNDAQLYVYDFNKQTSTPITLEETKTLRFVKDFDYRSPDGFFVNPGCNSPSPAMFLQDISDTHYKTTPTVCLVKKRYQRNLTLALGSTLSPTAYFIFLGWIYP